MQIGDLYKDKDDETLLIVVASGVLVEGWYLYSLTENLKWFYEEEDLKHLVKIS